MRVATHQPGRIVQADAGECGGGRFVSAFGVHSAMAAQHLRHLPAQGQGRVEGGGGVLEHHADAAAANVGNGSGIETDQVLAVEQNVPARFDGVGRQGAHHRPGEAGLAGA